MPDRKPKPERITPRKEKICKTCGRTFQWRKERAQDWDIIRHCSDVCRNHKATASEGELESAILSLLAERGPGKTICPSEAAKLVARDAGRGTKSAHDKDRPPRRLDREAWEALMEPARAVARRLVVERKIVITQHNQIVDPSTAKGPIRLRLR